MKENKHMNGVCIYIYIYIYIYINEEDTVANYLHMFRKFRRVKKTPRLLPM